MLTFIFYTLIFLCGMIAANIDWEKFIQEAFDFNHVNNPVSLFDFSNFYIKMFFLS